MASAASTPGQSETPDEDHDETMPEQSEEEEGDSRLQNINHDDANDGADLEDGQPASAAEPTDYSLFSNPPDLARVRQSLFALEESLEMSPTDFDAYFPFVDNVWRKARGADVQTEHRQSADVYWCRLRKAPGAKPHIPRPTPEGKQSRRKRVKEEKSCGMAMKVAHSDAPVRRVIVSRVADQAQEHSHDLEYMDGLKRNSAIMDAARKETSRAFLPTSVFWKMWQEPDKMNDAGGKLMKVSDVRNVQYAWRQENPSIPLKAHTGFSTQRAAQGSAATKTKRPSSSKQVIAKSESTTPSKPQHARVAHPSQPSPSKHPALKTLLHSLPPDTLQYPDHARTFLQPYLPDVAAVTTRQRPHITLTWASSLDGRIAITPGHRTTLSGPETKAMTHYLRSRHDAILVGVRTAIADDPSLNCRLSGVGGYGGTATEHQPRPIVIDPNARLLIRPDMNVLKVVAEGRAKAPWIVVAPHANLHPVAVQTLKSHGGEFLMINDFNSQTGGFSWEGIFNVLYREGIRSIMIEGGGVILSELIKPKYAHLIDSVITTIAPTYLGKLGVQVSQDSCLDGRGGLLPTRLKEVKWQPMGDVDVVMCGRVRAEEGLPLQQLQYVTQPVSQPPPLPQQPPPQHPPPMQQQQQQLHHHHHHHHHQHHQQPPPAPPPPQTNGYTRRSTSGSGTLQGIEEFSNSAPQRGGEMKSPPTKRARNS